MLDIGGRAPEFTLPDHTGQVVSSEHAAARGAADPLLLPGGFHAGLYEGSLLDPRSAHGDSGSGADVAGVSPQSPESHRKFREKYQLPFTLLSDTDKVVIKMYDVVGPLGFGVRRATYLIDQSRKIRSAVLADFRIGLHEDFIRKAVALSAGT